MLLGKEATERLGGTKLNPAGISIALSLLGCSPAAQLTARDVTDANDTGRELAAQTEGERSVLRDLGRLPQGVKQRVGEIEVVADVPYIAASGRTCRALVLSTESEHQSQRLACSDGQAWFFVPDVFGTSTGQSE